MEKKEITEIKKLLAEWYASNHEVYSAFREKVDKAIENGDMQLYEEILKMLKGFIPDSILKNVESEIESYCKREDCIIMDQESLYEAMQDPESKQQILEVHEKMEEDMMPEAEVVVNNISERIKGKDAFVFCYYYWMVFDNGPTEVVSMFSNYLRKNRVGFLWRYGFKLVFRAMVKQSYSVGLKKIDWKRYQKKEQLDDAKANIMLALEESKKTGGKTVDCRNLKELVDNPNVIDVIGIVVDRRRDDSDIAYMLMNLRINGMIPDIPYTTFHRALQNAFPEKNIKGHSRPQGKYAELRRLYKMNTDVPCSLNEKNQAIARKKIEALNTYFLPFKVK